SERLRRLANAMASASGLAAGDRRPILAAGAVGPVRVSIFDMPRNAQLGAQIDFTFPDLELGLSFRDASHFFFSEPSKLLPEDLRARHRLETEPAKGRPPIPFDDVAAFVRAVFHDVHGADELHFSDHHLSVYVKLADDEIPTMTRLAEIGARKAKEIGDAISALPFPAAVANARPKWERFAIEHDAFLVPTGPSIHGVVLRARVTAGDERTIGATLRTAWSRDVHAIDVDVDLRGAPLLAKTTFPSKEIPNEHALAVRAAFPTVTIAEDGLSAHLAGAAWQDDPAPLYSALETFFSWVLQTRKEKRQDSPYR
ncbi:MAG TPA: hypothetical protein VF407_09960, partial [Polyangiaceae bacterium]